MDIVVKGQIDQNWSEWFDSFEITHTTANSFGTTAPGGAPPSEGAC